MSPSREVGPSTHCMLTLTFTMEGIATYTVQMTDYTTGYAPILRKKIRSPWWDTVDYGGWYSHRRHPSHGISTRMLAAVAVLLVREEAIAMPPGAVTSS